MAVTRTVRVTRTWDVAVEADYGDDYHSLCAKVTEEHLDATIPGEDVRVVLEEHESSYDKWFQRPDAPDELNGVTRKEAAAAYAQVTRGTG